LFFDGVGKIAKHYAKDDKGKTEAQNRIERIGERIGEIDNRAKAIQHYFSQLNIIKQQVAKGELTPEQTKEKIADLTALQGTNIGIGAALAGNTDIAIEQLNSDNFKKLALQNITQEEAAELGLDNPEAVIGKLTNEFLLAEKLVKDNYNAYYTYTNILKLCVELNIYLHD
jgi:polyhydroxyalkanoate synthesis regulator phasin